MGRGHRQIRDTDIVVQRRQAPLAEERAERIAVTLWVARAPKTEHLAVEVEVAAYDTGFVWAYDLDEATSGGSMFGPATVEFLRSTLPSNLAEVITHELQAPYAGRPSPSHE